MRVANLLVSGLGLAALAAAMTMVWRWRSLPVVGPTESLGSTGQHAAAAVRSLGAELGAGLVSGILVLGLVGRLVMRALAATSGDSVQGLRTEAEETVGAITAGGTAGFVVFVGVFGGLVTAMSLGLVRRWLPRTAGAAGLVGGALLVGSVGVAFPLSPHNVDFAILGPRWLAIVTVIATGVLSACTYAALAARLRKTVAQPGWRRWLPCAGLVAAVVPPVAVYAIVYIGGRAVAAGRIDRWLATPGPARLGKVVLAIAAVAATAVAVTATAQIASI